jgi:hypothetical protein
VSPKPLSTSGVVQLVTRRARTGERADSQFFTTWATLEQGQWRSDLVSQALQIARSAHWGYRPFAQEFHILQSIDIARTIVRSNPEHGPGGGEKLFIPAEQHAFALEPVGDPIPLFASGDHLTRDPTEFLKALIELELSLGNALVGADADECSGGRARFWLQDPLHATEIARLTPSSSACAFEERDIHGDSMGFLSIDQSEILIAPLSATAPPKRSWLANLRGSERHRRNRVAVPAQQSVAADEGRRYVGQTGDPLPACSSTNRPSRCLSSRGRTALAIARPLSNPGARQTRSRF